MAVNKEDAENVFTLPSLVQRRIDAAIMPSRSANGASIHLLRESDTAVSASFEAAMAGAKGLEPSTSAVTGLRSNQLSYAPTMTK
jgi:hypothetical protein